MEQTTLIIQSQALGTTAAVGVVVPDEVHSIMLLLHGYNGSYEDLDEKLTLMEYAKNYQMLLCIPNMGNAYYMNHDGQDVAKFIAKELPAILKEKYHLPTDFPVSMSGISMGGYGTMLIGMNYPESFHSLTTTGGAFIAKDVYIGNPQVVGNTSKDKDAMAYFLKTFGPIDVLEDDSKRNPVAAILNVDTQKTLPVIHILCGMDDLLYERQPDVLKALTKKQIPFTWKESANENHTFSFFGKSLCWAWDRLRKENIL